jgi:hypothetical protein
MHRSDMIFSAEVSLSVQGVIFRSQEAGTVPLCHLTAAHAPNVTSSNRVCCLKYCMHFSCLLACYMMIDHHSLIEVFAIKILVKNMKLVPSPVLLHLSSMYFSSVLEICVTKLWFKSRYKRNCFSFAGRKERTNSRFQRPWRVWLLHLPLVGSTASY